MVLWSKQTLLSRLTILHWWWVVKPIQNPLMKRKRNQPLTRGGRDTHGVIITVTVCNYGSIQLHMQRMDKITGTPIAIQSWKQTYSQPFCQSINNILLKYLLHGYIICIAFYSCQTPCRCVTWYTCLYSGHKHSCYFWALADTIIPSRLPSSTGTGGQGHPQDSTLQFLV